MAKTYESYKDSGIAWLPQIPQSWNTRRLKDVGFLYGGLTGKSGEDFNVDDDEDSYMLYIPFTNIFNNSVINPKQMYKVKIEKGEHQNLVFKDDLLFLMSSEDYDGVGKPAIIEEQIDNLGLNSFCKGFRVTDNKTLPKYLFYYLSSHISREQVRQEAKGFIRINLRQDKLSCCNILVPPFDEQRSIASFLDTKCDEIDSLISLQEEMISELQAYKQSVITEAVTKGLDPNAKMNCCASREKNDACISSSETQPAIERKFKDSGVEWIGEIPSEWKVEKARHLFTQRNSKGNDTPVLLSATQLHGMYPQHLLEGVVQVHKDTDLQTFKTVHKNDYVISLRSFQGGFEMSDFEGVCSPAYQVFYNISKICHQYYKLLFKSQGFISMINSLVVGIREGKNIQYGSFSYSYLPVPPINEQEKIASYLDAKTSQIDSLISLKQQKIDELKSYKKSIIYEYVTGKKRV